MKIDCGPTPKQRKQMRIDRLGNWHTVFAIWPTRVGPNECRWMEEIERKGRPHCAGLRCGQWVSEYRAKATGETP